MPTPEFYLGKRSYAALAVESSYGTPNTATTWAYPGKVQKISPDEKQDLKALEGLDYTDSGREVGEYYAMVPRFGLTMETLIQYGRTLALGIGADTKTGTDPYTHTIEIGNTLPSFGLIFGHHHSANAFYRRADGCVIGRNEINIAKNDWVRLSQTIVSQNMTKVGAIKDYQSVVDSLKKYETSDVRPYRGSDNTTTINSVDISAQLMQAKLVIDNSLKVDEALDSSIGELIAPPVPEVTDMSASISVKMKEDDLWDLFKAGAKVENCSFALTRGADSITFNFDGTWFKDQSDPIDVGQGIVVQDLNMNIAGFEMVEVNPISTDYDTICS